MVKRRHAWSRRGTLMLLLLVVLVVFGIMSLKLIPAVAVQAQRRDETDLRSTLSRIRHAFDLKRRIDPSFPPGGVSATQALEILVEEGFLATADIKDATIPPQEWAVGINVWQIGTNVAYHTSFEVNDLATDPANLVASWVKSQDVKWGVASQFFPSKDSSAFDDYPGQNLLGQTFEASGSSLMIVKP